MNLSHETDIEVLRQKAQVLLQENERLAKKIVGLTRENMVLKGLSPEQLQTVLALLDDELNKATRERPAASTERRALVAEPKERAPQHGHGPRPQPSLPIEPVRHELDEADTICPTCGGELTLWQGQDDESEEIDVIARRLVTKKHVRPKYRCHCGCIEMAHMPPRLVPGGRYSNDLAVEVASDKYDNFMPALNGRELADRVRALHPGVRRVFMSGYTAKIIAHQGMLDPGSNFLQKPFSQQDLATKLREVLGRPPGS